MTLLLEVGARAGLDPVGAPRGTHPIAIRYAKESVGGGLGLPLAHGIMLENDLSTLLRTIEARVEGAKPFVEKRKPSWTGG